MKHPRIVALFVCVAWMCIAGCGSNTKVPPSAPTPVANACKGAVISGAMQDSLTGQPVAQGWAVLESGTQLGITPIFNFAPSQKVASDVHGAFSLCAPAIPQPAVIVLEALDSSGNAYPPFVAPVSGTIDVGTIPMGICRLTCGFVGQQQTSPPTTIKGTITSAPIAKTGSVMAQFALSALDGSKNVWSLVAPGLDPAQSNTFNTTAGVCAGNAPFCAAYTLTVPSQNPIERMNGGFRQQAGAPGYSINAVVDSPASCMPPFGFTIRQQDGTFLIGAPGAQLSAADIAFTGCQ